MPFRNSAQITGQMTSDAQTKMADELKNTRDQISQIKSNSERSSLRPADVTNSADA